MPSPRSTKSGFAAIVGRPNVGKSTLLNAIIGEKISITTHKPQTTRNRILGILTRGKCQTVFLDTPGVHRAKGGINKRMVQIALDAISDVDLVIHMVEAGERPDEIGDTIITRLAKTGKPALLVVNKIDLFKRKDDLLPEMQRLAGATKYDEVVPVSALNGDGVDLLVQLIEKRLPKGPHFYPPDDFTDVTERFLAAEMIREQIILHTREEVPYAAAVSIDEYSEGAELTRIRAIIHVETDSQKGIVIGAKGSMLKMIGSDARRNIEKMVGTKVFLEMFVDVIPNWRRDEKALDKLGYVTEPDKTGEEKA